MRDTLALLFIQLARKFTSWGDVGDHLELAEMKQRFRRNFRTR